MREYVRFSGSKTSYLPLVLACHMSKTALGMPLPVSASLMTPWKKVSCPSGGMFWTTLSPFSRKGVSGDQKGPRMVDDVGSAPLAAEILWLISSTSLLRGCTAWLACWGDIEWRGSLVVSQNCRGLSGTYDSTPRMSHTRHASLRFFL